MALEQARKWLAKRGFTEQVWDREHGMTATLYLIRNPHTGQKANLSHHYEKKGRPVDLAKIAFHLMEQPKRRTPEQKLRDHFILYD